MSRNLPLNALRVFEAAARHGSFTRAGDELGMTQTAVSYQVKLLEETLGETLFLRQPRQVVLSEAGESIKRFLESGVTELGKKLGPLLWQFAPTKKFDEADFGGFLDLLPKTFDGHTLRHVVEVRNDTFKTPAFIALARKAGVAICYAEHETYTEIADLTADFVYARLQKGNEKLKAGYLPKALDTWADRARTWSKGGAPTDLAYVDKKAPKDEPRDTFIYFIHEAKVRAPAAAMALIERVS